MNWKKYLDYTIKLVEETPVCMEPYAHIALEQTFHPDLFEQMVAHWPHGHSFWVNNTQNFNVNRRQMPIPHNLEIWDELYHTILCDNNLIQLCYDKFQLVNDYLFTSATLWEDTAGYEVGAHVDQYKIAIAWQTYITMDKNATGTELYHNNQGSLAKSLPGIPNSGWLMLNDAYSWHGLPKQDISTPRRSLMNRLMRL